MTLGDLYPDVRLYSEVETIIMTGEEGGGGRVRWEEGVGGHMGRVGGDGRRWQGDEERGAGWGVRELFPEVGREGNVWGEEMAPPLQSCALCVLLTASEH